MHKSRPSTSSGVSGPSPSASSSRRFTILTCLQTPRRARTSLGPHQSHLAVRLAEILTRDSASHSPHSFCQRAQRISQEVRELTRVASVETLGDVRLDTVSGLPQLTPVFEVAIRLRRREDETMHFLFESDRALIRKEIFHLRHAHGRRPEQALGQWKPRFSGQMFEQRAESALSTAARGCSF